MSDKLKVIGLAVLVAVLAIWWWLGGRTPEERDQRSFREYVVQVDTARLTEFTLMAPLGKRGVPIRFLRDSLGWTAVQEGHSTRAFHEPLNALLEALADLRPQAVAGSDPAVVQRYGLSDSAAAWFQSPQVENGVPLRIGGTSEGLGTPTMNAPPVATAVMLEGDPNVYLIAGIFNDIPNMSFVDWIPKPMVNGNPADWDRLVFTFPGNMSYSLERQGHGWTVSGEPADQRRVERYLYALSRYYGTGLADANDTLGAQLAYQLRVDDRTRDTPIFLGVFQAGNHFIARSTLAPSWLVMPFSHETELPRMFRYPEAFLPHPEPVDSIH